MAGKGPKGPDDAAVNTAEGDRTLRPSEAFEAFVGARQRQLLRSAFLITGDPDLAEDLLQEALIKLALNWSRVRVDPEPYVRAILYRDAVSWWRRRRREFVCARPPETVTSDLAHDSATRVVFVQALARLTRKQRAVLVLRYFEDLSEQATAHALGVSVGTVKSQTHTALERLREFAPELGDFASPRKES